MAPLTGHQKHELCRLAMVGCRRETAAWFIGCHPDAVAQAIADDPGFAADLHRGEAAIELAHMRCVQLAIRDEKNYRAAIWWLENASQEGYLRRASDALTKAELARLMAAVAAAVESEVANPDERTRLAARLAEIAGGRPAPTSEENR